MVLLVLLLATLPAAAQALITSAASGSWTTGATWVGGQAPTIDDDVLIAAGHTIAVDGTTGVCRSITFGANTGLIKMNANGMLTVYGDITLFSTTHIAFSAGWSATSAYIKFAGPAVQTLRGWSTSGGSTSFRDVIIDKDGGKVTTAGNNMRLGIQNSLEIVNGIFELAGDDDIEGRFASSGNYTSTSTSQSNLPNVTVRSGGEFTMVGSGAHHIRSGSLASPLTQYPIGVMTVYGKATFMNGSTIKLNLVGINVESGGKVVTSTSLSPKLLECGPLRVKAGGEIENYTTSDIWGATDVLTLDVGGLIDTKSTTTIFPASFTNNGTVRYSREGSAQTVVARNYANLEISLDAVFAKGLDLAADYTVSDTLRVNGTAILQLTATAPHTLTVGKVLYLASGSLDNTNANAALTLADGALIQRATGALAAVPAFAGAVDLRYSSTAATVTTGPELPAAAGVLRNFTLSGDQGVTLGADMLVGGACTIAGSDLTTGAFGVTLGSAATLVESPGATIIGTVRASRTVAQAATETFGGIGLDLTAAGAEPGLTEVVRTTLPNPGKSASDGILRLFDVTAANNSGLDATAVFHYDESELNGIPESALVMFTGQGGAWAQVGSLLDETANTVTAAGLPSCAQLTLGAEGVVANLLANAAAVLRGSIVDVTWSTNWPADPANFVVYRATGADGQTLLLGAAVVATGANSFAISDATGEPGASYRYRVEVQDGDSAWVLFETAAIEIQRSPLRLAQNLPNPFNPQTKIEFSLPRAGHVVLGIFDVSGRQVARLVDGAMTAGTHAEVWTGQDDAGNPVASGTYFYRLDADGASLVRKMVLLK
jgi:hypothetical protein